MPAESLEAINAINAEVVNCTRCPRLVAWREQVAREKKKQFAGWDYWGRPVPGFGDPDARLLIVGLAPAAHGANRTGRMFTGDRSGDFLYRSLHHAGFANQPTSTHAGDGLTLTGAYVSAPVRCAPPANQPLPSERDNCFPYLLRELRAMPQVNTVVALGNFAYMATLRLLTEAGHTPPRPRPKFAHGLEVPAGPVTVLCSFHPSQQNTFTGKLTQGMLDTLFARARELTEVGR